MKKFYINRSEDSLSGSKCIEDHLYNKVIDRLSNSNLDVACREFKKFIKYYNKELNVECFLDQLTNGSIKNDGVYVNIAVYDIPYDADYSKMIGKKKFVSIFSIPIYHNYGDFNENEFKYTLETVIEHFNDMINIKRLYISYKRSLILRKII